MSTSRAPAGEEDWLELSHAAASGQEPPCAPVPFEINPLLSCEYPSTLQEPTDTREQSSADEQNLDAQDTPGLVDFQPLLALNAQSWTDTRDVSTSGIPTGEEDRWDSLRAVGPPETPRTADALDQLEPNSQYPPTLQGPTDSQTPSNTLRLQELFRDRDKALACLQSALQPMLFTIDGIDRVGVWDGRDEIAQTLAHFEAVHGPIQPHERTWEQGVDDSVLIACGFRDASVDQSLLTDPQTNTAQTSSDTDAEIQEVPAPPQAHN